MSNIQHEEARLVLSMIKEAVARGETLTYSQVAVKLGRNPRKEGRAVAAFCDLLDAAAALAGVPSLALVAVRENGSRKINERAWRGRDVPAWLREEIIARALRHMFVDSDFHAIEKALERLASFGNKLAWAYVRKTYPGASLHQRLVVGNLERSPSDPNGPDNSAELTKVELQELVGSSHKRALLIYLKKEEYKGNFEFDSRLRVVRSGFWKPARQDFERVVIYQKYGGPSGANAKQRSLIWIGDSAGQTEVDGGKVVFRVKDVEGPFFTSLSFRNLSGLAEPQAGWCYYDSTAKSEQDDANLSAQSTEDEEYERETAAKKEIWVRRYQGLFKSKLIKVWGNRCAVTDVTELGLLRASHIRPWSESTHKERLSQHNGLLLSAHLDALFDRHLISFDESGNMRISSKLSQATRKVYGLRDGLKLRIRPQGELNKFMAAHEAKLI
jgi:hypothetical protein